MPAEKLIVALDFPDARRALELVARLGREVNFYKVGLELFTAAGPSIVEKLKESGKRVFLDLKFFDIPATMAGAARAAARLGADMINLHLLAGTEAVRATREAAREEASSAGFPPPLVIGVTVLTSVSARDLAETGFPGEPARLVEMLASRAAHAGLDGVVASAREAAALKRQQGDGFLVVTPGIRLSGSPGDDQARIMSPGAALAAGSDYLVVGRPVTRAADPAAACRLVIEDCRRAFPAGPGTAARAWQSRDGRKN